jgi:hypothetical protein
MRSARASQFNRSVNADAQGRLMVKKVEAPNPRNSHSQVEREALYFAAMMRVLDREMPSYAG